MTARLQKAETAAANESLVSEMFSREASMVAKRADGCAPEQRDPADRKLRNRIIIANVIAWIAIIALIGLIFF
jgi:hypothetical protein